MKRVALAIFFAVCFLHSAAANDMFKKGSTFSLPVTWDLVVKDQTVLYGRRGKEFNYGDTCTPNRDAKYHVLIRHENIIGVRYEIGRLLNENDCPMVMTTVLDITKLEAILSMIREENELKLTRGFQQQLKK